MMDCEVKEYFSILLEACHVEEISLDVAYRQLRELLERLCRTQMPDGSLQMTDLSARISFVASKAGLSTVEQNRLHTFRLTSNAILNRQAEPLTGLLRPHSPEWTLSFPLTMQTEPSWMPFCAPTTLGDRSTFRLCGCYEADRGEK